MTVRWACPELEAVGREDVVSDQRFDEMTLCRGILSDLRITGTSQCFLYN